MFTLKFIRQNGSQESLAGARYSLTQESPDCKSVRIYPTLKAENGVVINLSLNEDETTFYELFVENETGKTVDRIRAPSPVQPHIYPGSYGLL